MSQYLEHIQLEVNNVELCLKDIEKAAGWQGSSLFRKYYNLPLTKNFGEEILGDFNKSCNKYVGKKHFIVQI